MRDGEGAIYAARILVGAFREYASARRAMLDGEPQHPRGMKRVRPLFNSREHREHTGAP